MNVTFRNNFVHHNVGDGIWYDGNNNAAALVEGNRVEDNGRTGITYEISNGATIRNNTLRRNAGDAVLISVSQNVQIYNNSLEANFGSIQYFLNCAALLEGYDLKNNAAYDNTVVVGTQSDTYANGFSSTVVHLSTAGAVSEWLEEPDLLPQHLPRAITLLGSVLLWGGPKHWNEWRTLGHDVDGSLIQD